MNIEENVHKVWPYLHSIPEPPFQEYKTSAFLATMRRGILLIPSALVLNALFGLNGLEFSQGICDVLTGLVTLPFVAAFLRHLPADGTPMQRGHRAKAS